MAARDLARVKEIAECLGDAPHWTEAAYTTALNPESTPRRIALVAATADEGRLLAASPWPASCRRKPSWRRLLLTA